MSRLEFLLNALNNGGDIKDFEPQSRCEEILKACCTGDECEVEPQSRIEALLKILHAKGIASGGGGSAEEEWFNDGNTHIWISLSEGRTSPMLGCGVNGTVTVDWGDGTEPDVLTGTNAKTTKYTPTHHYESDGDYVITLIVDGEAMITSSLGCPTLLTYQQGEHPNNYQYFAAIKSIEIGHSVTKIRSYAFYHHYNLSSINIPDSVTSIEPGAFECCCNLSSINIPDSVTSIGNSVFCNCRILGKIRFEGVTPPAVSASNAFADIPYDCIISVPVGCLDAYKTATNYPNPNTYTYVEE